MQVLHIPLILPISALKCNGINVLWYIQYRNIQYTNIVVKMDKKSNFYLLKIVIVVNCYARLTENFRLTVNITSFHGIDKYFMLRFVEYLFVCLPLKVGAK